MRKIASRVLVLICAVMLTLLSIGPAQAIDVQETLAYKLAVIHTSALDPERLMLQGNIEPQQSVVAEFQWLLDSLRPNCLNPDTALADTMVETWQVLNHGPQARNLLEIARELTRFANSTARSRNEKVNFRLTSRFWLAQEVKKDDVLGTNVPK